MTVFSTSSALSAAGLISSVSLFFFSSSDDSLFTPCLQFTAGHWFFFFFLLFSFSMIFNFVDGVHFGSSSINFTKIGTLEGRRSQISYLRKSKFSDQRRKLLSVRAKYRFGIFFPNFRNEFLVQIPSPSFRNEFLLSLRWCLDRHLMMLIISYHQVCLV